MTYFKMPRPKVMCRRECGRIAIYDVHCSGAKGTTAEDLTVIMATDLCGQCATETVEQLRAGR